MKKTSIVLLISSLFYFSCKQNSPVSGKNKDEVIDTTKFFQIARYFHSEIAAVNKTPYYIYKIDIANSRKDSVPINNEIFNKISNSFYNPDINNPDLKKYYTENIFFDETTKTFTISYSTTNKDLEIQSIEILLKEDGETVKRVFIRKFFNYGDSSAIEQLSWKAGESFRINRAVQKGNNEEDAHQTIVVWNEKS